MLKVRGGKKKKSGNVDQESQVDRIFSFLNRVIQQSKNKYLGTI